jgi:uncharacterized protein (TIGR02996 family)
MPKAKPFNSSAEYRGLIDDVVRNPRDEAPRLVLADWLEEFGGERGRHRASLIRVGWDGRTPLRFTQTFPELRYVLLAGWRWPDVCVDGHWYRRSTGRRNEHFVALRRGFVCKICTDLIRWRYFGPGLLRRHPVERIQLADKSANTVVWYSGAGWDDTQLNVLPEEVYRMLAGGEPRQGGSMRDYESEALAAEDLTRAMRILAGA